MKGVSVSCLLCILTTPDRSLCPRAASGSMDLITTDFGDRLRTWVKQGVQAFWASSEDHRGPFETS